MPMSINPYSNYIFVSVCLSLYCFYSHRGHSTTGYNKSNPIMNIFWFSERTQRSSLCFTFSFPFWNVPDILKLIFPQTFGVNLKQELEDVNINYIQINFPYFFEK